VARTLAIALTIDDAPSIAASGPLAFDAGRMDATRRALQDAGVRSCVAFVIGAHARGHEKLLGRWLDAGYELGNHSDDHAYASRTGFHAFTASVERCDALLREVGAFDGGRPRYFRFPYGDRGASPSRRGALLEAVENLGYQLAEVSIQTYDHCYEARFALALANHDDARARAVTERYLDRALASVHRASRLAGRRFGPDHEHVMAMHFGPVTERTLPALLARLSTCARLVPLERALACPAYLRDASDLAANGVIAERLGGRADPALRRLARIARRAGLFEQDALGPLWPHFSD
jgi:peptidoglycan/xylan/chitin deacetylase (PgdA/CDA1 family)